MREGVGVSACMCAGERSCSGVKSLHREEQKEANAVSEVGSGRRLKNERVRKVIVGGSDVKGNGWKEDERCLSVEKISSWYVEKGQTSSR